MSVCVSRLQGGSCKQRVWLPGVPRGRSPLRPVSGTKEEAVPMALPPPRCLWVTGQARPVRAVSRDKSHQKLHPSTSCVTRKALHVGAAICILVSQMTRPPPLCPANWGSPGASGSTQLPFLPESGPAVPKAHLGRPSSSNVSHRDQHSELLGVCSQDMPPCWMF